MVAHAAAGAVAGENYGFIVLRKGAVTRRIPYLFLVSRPALAAAQVLPLRRTQTGDTRSGTSRVSEYRYPVAPFGNAPDEPPMVQDGAEHVYATTVERPAVNAGVSILDSSSGARIDTWYLGALDENTVQGFAGTPVDVNNFTYDYLQPVGAAGAAFPRQGRYFVSVDSGRNRFTGKSAAGSYVLRSWVDDVTPPSLGLLTTRVSTGRPTLAFRVRDTQSGVDAQSLAIGYKGVLVAAASYDRDTGIAVFPLPSSVPALAAGTTRTRMIASDFQEAKNIDTIGPSSCPTRALVPCRCVSSRRRPWIGSRHRAAVARRTRRGSSSRRVPREAWPPYASQSTASAPPSYGRATRACRTASLSFRSLCTRPAHRDCDRCRQAGTHRFAETYPARVPRVAIVTGASSGIGAEIARLLAGRGWQCVLLARREERLRALADEIGGEYELCDVTDRAAVEQVAARILARHPSVHLLVNNAGIPGRSNFLDGDPERFELVMRTNYFGSVWCLRAFLPGLEAAAPADVVNIVSVSGVVAFPPSGPYSASKHAQLALSRATAPDSYAPAASVSTR